MRQAGNGSSAAGRSASIPLRRELSALSLLLCVAMACPALARERCAGRQSLAPTVLRTARRLGLQIAFNPARLANFCTDAAYPANPDVADLRRALALAGLRMVQLDRHLFALVPAAHVRRRPAVRTFADPSPAIADPGEGDTIVVLGSISAEDGDPLYRRVRDGIGDTVSGERASRLSPGSVADALRLVPGVQLDNQRGNGVYMFARGLDSSFHLAEINGRPVALNELVENGGPRGRAYRFEMIPAAFVGRLDVAKAGTPADGEAAVGVTVDMQLLHPFDAAARDGLSLEGNDSDWRRASRVALTGTGRWTSADERLGVLLMAQQRRRAIRNDRFFEFQWARDRFPGVLPPGSYTPGRVRPTIETEDRQQRSALLAVQWRPAPGQETTASLFVTRLDVDYDEFGLDIYPDDPTYVQPQFVPGSAVLRGDTVVAGRIDPVRWMASRETSRNRHDLIVAGARHRIERDAWRLTADLGLSRAHSYQPEGMGTSRSRMAFFGPLGFDFSGGYRTAATLTTDRSLTDPASYVGWTYVYAPKDSLDTTATARIDGERIFPDRSATTLRLGAGWQRRDRDYRRRDLFLDTLRGVPATDARLGPDSYEILPFDNFLGGVPTGSPSRWLVPTARGIASRLLTPDVLATPPGNDDRIGSYVIREQIVSGYAQLRTGMTLFHAPLVIEGGVRLAQTGQISTGYSGDATAARPVRYARNYLSVLPGASLRWEPSDTATLRLVVGRSVTRPNLTEIAPRLTTSLDNRTASGGNPMLRPFSATNIDLAIDYTPHAAHRLTANLFQRRLDDYITSANRLVDIPGEGRFLLSTTENGGRATLSGIELTGALDRARLPVVDGQLSLTGSLTLVTVRSVFRAGDRTIANQLVGLSRTSGVVTMRYDRQPFSLDLGWFWRGRYLNGYGTSAIGEEYVAPLGTVDGRIGLSVTPTLSVDLAATNLLGARKYLYGTSPAQPKEINLFGRAVMIAIHWRAPR